MTAYLIAQVKIHDPDGFRAYEKGFFPTLKPFDGGSSWLTERPRVWKAPGQKAEPC